MAKPVGSPGGPEVRHVLLHDGRRLAFACLGAPLTTARLQCIYYHGGWVGAACTISPVAWHCCSGLQQAVARPFTPAASAHLPNEGMNACSTTNASCSLCLHPCVLYPTEHLLHLSTCRAGVPASLVEAEPLAAAAAPLGIAIVAFDRPGMGSSSPHAAMSVHSVAADAAALMSELGLQAAVQVGESGGAPYAAAFAALHPERTQQVGPALAVADGRGKALWGVQVAAGQRLGYAATRNTRCSPQAAASCSP